MHLRDFIGHLTVLQNIFSAVCITRDIQLRIMRDVLRPTIGITVVGDLL